MILYKPDKLLKNNIIIANTRFLSGKIAYACIVFCVKGAVALLPDDVCENNTCVRVICTAGKTFATVDKMFISADIILIIADIVYSGHRFSLFFSYIYTYNADFVYTIRIKSESFGLSTLIVMVLSALFVKTQRLCY